MTIFYNKSKSATGQEPSSYLASKAHVLQPFSFWESPSERKEETHPAKSEIKRLKHSLDATSTLCHNTANSIEIKCPQQAFILQRYYLYLTFFPDELMCGINHEEYTERDKIQRNWLSKTTEEKTCKEATKNEQDTSKNELI